MHQKVRVIRHYIFPHHSALVANGHNKSIINVAKQYGFYDIKMSTLTIDNSEITSVGDAFGYTV